MDVDRAKEIATERLNDAYWGDGGDFQEVTPLGGLFANYPENEARVYDSGDILLGEQQDILAIWQALEDFEDATDGLQQDRICTRIGYLVVKAAKDYGEKYCHE